MSHKTPISASLEDYLEVILELDAKGSEIRVTDLAEELHVAKSSVNQAVKRLVEMNLLKHKRYGPLELTPMGTLEAQRIKGRHALIKEFLTEILGVDPATADKDACGMEHSISPPTVERLVHYLENTLHGHKSGEP